MSIGFGEPSDWSASNPYGIEYGENGNIYIAGDGNVTIVNVATEQTIYVYSADSVNDVAVSTTTIYQINLDSNSYYNYIDPTVTPCDMILSCAAASRANGYKWERSADGVSGWTQIADTASNTTGISQAVHGINSSVVNYFRVKAYNSAGESGYSSPVMVQCGV